MVSKTFFLQARAMKNMLHDPKLNDLEFKPQNSLKLAHSILFSDHFINSMRRNRSARYTMLSLF